MPIALAVRMRAPDFEHLIEGMTSDISLGGVFLHTGSPRKIGTQVDLEISLERENKVLHCRGIVVRSIDLESARQSDVQPGMGIKFTGFPTGDDRLLDALIQRHLKKQG